GQYCCTQLLGSIEGLHLQFVAGIGDLGLGGLDYVGGVLRHARVVGGAAAGHEGGDAHAEDQHHHHERGGEDECLIGELDQDLTDRDDLPGSLGWLQRRGRCGGGPGRGGHGWVTSRVKS